MWKIFLSVVFIVKIYNTRVWKETTSRINKIGEPLKAIVGQQIDIFHLLYIATGRLPTKKKNWKSTCAGVCVRVYTTIGIFEKRRVELACPWPVNLHLCYGGLPGWNWMKFHDRLCVAFHSRHLLLSQYICTTTTDDLKSKTVNWR